MVEKKLIVRELGEEGAFRKNLRSELEINVAYYPIVVKVEC
jgi:hypothetical protein